MLHVFSMFGNAALNSWCTAKLTWCIVHLRFYEFFKTQNPKLSLVRDVPKYIKGKGYIDMKMGFDQGWDSVEHDQKLI